MKKAQTDHFHPQGTTHSVAVDPELMRGPSDVNQRKELKFVAKVRNGFVPHMRCAMFPLLQQFRADKCPFGNLPEKRRGAWALNLTNGEMQNCQWLKPQLVAQIEFIEGTPDGHLRHASFAGTRDDKEPRSIVRE